MRDRGKKGKKGGDRIRTDKDTKRGIERAERERDGDVESLVMMLLVEDRVTG
jgi:hypothetical protein